jgi:cytochrome b
MKPRTVPVWYVPVRALHWTLAAAVACAWFTGERYLTVHQVAGWAALAAVVLRLAWGFAGGRHARFRQFVRGPRHTARYALAVLAGRAPRHLGHNPLGGWMALALLGCVTALGITGWLWTTDRWWGDPGLEALHAGLAWTLAGLIAVHVAGAVLTGLRHRENLVAAMLDGKKRAAAPGDVA